jgi:hypothetical protein
LLTSLPAAALAAQSSGDAQEAARQIESLRQELEEARRRIAELERELEAARQATQTPAAPTAPPAAEPELPPEAALRSPAHFTRFLREAYVRELSSQLPENPRGGLPTAAQRAIERWVAAKNREWRKPVTWLARLRELSRTENGASISVSLLDPDSGETIGDPLTVSLDDRQARRVEQMQLRRPPPERWVLTGVFVPNLAVVPGRLQPGLFDNPPFIGPGVEFRFQILPESFAPEPPARKAPTTTAPTR